MVQFSTIIKQFGQQGEKTGWTYIDIPQEIAEKLKPGNKKTFRVKGKLDSYSFRGLALMPMGGGDFIMALNAEIRKKIGKKKGAKLTVILEPDDKFVIQPPPEFRDCLSDEPAAGAFFDSLAKSHQTYFIKWIDSAKTEQTRIKRIAQSISALSRKMGYGEMLRALQKERKDLF
jgi:bifunctional DNA-binding transcriptional regulator/antitoxin component of YhaV-PrlF toxin-antitoxin module